MASVDTGSSFATHSTGSHSRVGPKNWNYKRRSSKRLAAARLEYAKKLKTSLFAQSKQADFSISEEEALDNSSSQSDFDSSLSLNLKTSITTTISKKGSVETFYLDLDAFYRLMASRYISNILIFCPEAHSLSYLYKVAYGLEYDNYLLDREDCLISRRNDSFSPSILRTDTSRPRTRSICREEEKESSRLYYPSAAPHYITSKYQSQINSEMRSILVEWMMNVAVQLNTHHETIHCAVKLLDVGLETIVMTTDSFHCYGCACLLIACKLIEVKNTRAVDIAFFTDGACTTQEICAMELKICMELKFHLQTVTSFHFLDHFLDLVLVSSIIHDNDINDAVVRYNPKLHAMAMLIIETALVIPALVDVKDSLIAAASLYLARALIGVSEAIWNDYLVDRTGYNVDQLAETVTLLHRCHKNISHHKHMKSLFKKYNSATYHYVAIRTSIVASDLKL
eukprot:CAMPEP_0176501580 /NCGR_PEP_ID=MMETSP0200_2-20121128/14236_1 /TAXON_ID=947934 /ORGANISM="Chaetoceros sp., Strain GSL56" /LENGTH=453 /DNA_ID=CAMNT_0017900475 /DNA_START=503 /DNA_END=1864 /DNA_ORIENTATION=+